MKRRTHRQAVHHRKVARTPKINEGYMVLVRSWVLVVMFAIMLAVGTIVGTAMNTYLLQSSPQVAGASTSR